MSWLGELVGYLLGDLLGTALSPTSRKDSEVISGGEWNGSLGSLSSFVGSLAILFCLISFPLAFSYTIVTDAVLHFFISGFSLISAYFGLRWGLRAPHVTNRHLFLAKYGAVVSLVTLILTTLSIIIGVVRLLFI